jgi:cytochrome c oxidase subunit II
MAPSGSIFSPVSPHAEAISHLFVTTLWICAVIFAVVAGLVGYSLVRYRWREGDRDPAQLAGNKTIEIVWTVIPFGIVLLLFGLTLQAMERSDPPVTGDPDLIVVGHQWWWEIRDPKHGFVTANEIHIPVGRPLSVQLDATDVLHEFWVPQLTRKMTTVPGARNHVWLEAERPGTYQGVCSEFCGTQHAWMRFLVIAEPPAAYDAWVRTQQQPAATASARGRELFNQMTCVNCHAIRNQAGASLAALMAQPNSGPDLTHLAGRRQLGSGIVTNTPENLRRWLADPQQVKPGAKMPNFKLTREQIDALVAYLETLQ